MTRLVLQGVRRSFAEPTPRLVLNGVDLTLEPGELVALVGPSGRGKTTLLRIIAGLDRQHEGNVSCTGEAPRLGVVFQEARLVPWLTVLENLLFVAGKGAEAKARALLAAMELTGTETAFPRQLSGGMQRRLALARALLVQPNLLLLDEPLVSLDQALALRMREQLLAYWQRQRPTIVLVTHDLREAIALATRIVVLAEKEGTVALDRPITLAYPRHPEDPGIAQMIATLAQGDPSLLPQNGTSQAGTAG